MFTPSETHASSATGLTSSRPWLLASGSARSVHHLGEYIQLPLQRPDGSIAVALVTLADGHFKTKAEATLNGSGQIEITPRGRSKAVRAVRIVLRYLGLEQLGASIRLTSDAPVGRGFGSSTADCHAAVYAVLNALAIPAPEINNLDILQHVVFPAEGPCDPLALLGWGLPVLWGSRIGRLLDVYRQPLPSMVALGFVLDAERMVSTTELARTQVFTGHDVEAARPVFERFEAGLELGDVALIGEAATLSLTLNQPRCPTPRFEEVLQLAREVGAAGLAGSHSGTACALLWPADANPEAVSAAEARVRAWGGTYVHQFHPTSVIEPKRKTPCTIC